MTREPIAIAKATHLSADPESRAPCRCRKRPFLILFTRFLNAEPPLRGGKCFGPIARYRVPATNDAGNHQDVLWWQDTYQAMDWLFIFQCQRCRLLWERGV